MTLPSAVIAWSDPRRDKLAERVIAAMRHPWIASYTIGFAPPLARFNTQVVAALPGAKGAFDKLEIYVRHVLLDVNAAADLARKQVALQVRLRGPIDLADVSDRSHEALDLELRLHHLSTAPAKVADEMREAGITEVPREQLESLFLVRLDDPFGALLGHKLQVSGMVIEHRVHPEALVAWKAFAERQLPPLAKIIVP